MVRCAGLIPVDTPEGGFALAEWLRDGKTLLKTRRGPRGGRPMAQGGVMKILFTFPGQGTQHEGMLQNLPGTELAQAREVLGAEVDTLDSAASLTHTRAVQLSLLIAGVSGRAS